MGEGEALSSDITADTISESADSSDEEDEENDEAADPESSEIGALKSSILGGRRPHAPFVSGSELDPESEDN